MVGREDQGAGASAQGRDTRWQGAMDKRDKRDPNRQVEARPKMALWLEVSSCMGGGQAEGFGRIAAFVKMARLSGPELGRWAG